VEEKTAGWGQDYVTVAADQGVETAAELGPRIREKGKLSDAFIVDFLMRKYQWHQPLYRQAAILLREAGVELSRQTLGDAVMWVSRLLEPVREVMRQSHFRPR
jgi:transposase